MLRKWLNDLRRDRRDAERYRRMRLVLQDADRWLSPPEFAQGLAVVNWLQQGDAWHFDGLFLKRERTPHYSQDIARFRDELRAIGSVNGSEGMGNDHLDSPKPQNTEG
ncbi:MAG: hypothetical protein VX464_11555 [Pseudomonadota bacterium]|nr:hypothetical protein [Pseudomonadota bacterium]